MEKDPDHGLLDEHDLALFVMRRLWYFPAMERISRSYF